MKGFLSILLMGWGTLTAQPAQKEPAQLILYREKEFISRLGKAYAFTINGQPMGRLSPNRFVQLPIRAGRIKIEFSNDYFTDSQSLSMHLQAGQTYYVKAVLEVDFLSVMMVMEPVESARARRELLRMKPEVAPSTHPPE